MVWKGSAVYRGIHHVLSDYCGEIPVCGEYEGVSGIDPPGFGGSPVRCLHDRGAGYKASESGRYYEGSRGDGGGKYI